MIDYSSAINPKATRVEFMIYFYIGDAMAPGTSVSSGYKTQKIFTTIPSWALQKAYTGAIIQNHSSSKLMDQTKIFCQFKKLLEAQITLLRST